MSEIYELFDLRTANQIGTYDSEDEALRVVRRAIDEGHGDEFADVALGREDETGHTEVLWKGSELIRSATELQGLVRTLHSRQV